MRIVVKDPEDRNVRLWIPTGLVLNRFTALLAPMVLKDQEIVITREQAMTFIKTQHACKRRFPDWVMVEVQGAQGENVYIKL